MATALKAGYSVGKAKRGRGGRPRQTGARTASGRLAFVVDRGNARVVDRTARYACFQNGKAGHQVHDQIGRAWAVGLLDGREIDAAILRDIGRRYGALYWGEMADLAPRIGGFEPRSRGDGSGPWEDPRGEAFKRLDDMARAVGHAGFNAMQRLCVDEWWFPDANVDWVERLINTAMLKAKRPVAGEIDGMGDRDRLARAVDALIAMVGAGR